MDTGIRATILDRIYRLHDRVLAGMPLACSRRCSVCCTGNVILTTLEGEKIMAHLRKTGQEGLLERLQAAPDRQRFMPRITTNQLAALCLQGAAIPEETVDPGWGPCVFLENKECPIYPARPFGCRCMVSSVRCRAGGAAQLDPFLAAVNDLFMQYIEHLDAQGHTGNLRDVLSFLSSGEGQGRTASAARLRGAGLIQNQPIPALMIPPELRDRLAPIRQAIVNCADLSEGKKRA